jgi:Flp pilus assembly protein TadG
MAMKLRSLIDFGRDKTAAATIEYAMTLPLFLAALAFCFEFSQLFLAHQTTVNNVRSAARYLSRVNSVSAAETAARRIIRTGSPDSGLSAPSYLSQACRPPGPDCISTAGSRVRVQVRVEYPLIIFSLIGGDNRATIPFVVREDIQHVGM